MSFSMISDNRLNSYLFALQRHVRKLEPDVRYLHTVSRLRHRFTTIAPTLTDMEQQDYIYSVLGGYVIQHRLETT